MSEPITFKVDGVEVAARAGETILSAADRAGLYIPRLCAHRELEPYGACRVCTVLVNGRPQSACTQPATQGAVVENDTPQLREARASLIEMLFVEGNHFCMFCEKSGSCELQALAYRFGVLAPRYPYQFPLRTVDATHPEVLIDRNRCILCARCVRASQSLDRKNVFGFVGRGAGKQIAVNAGSGLRGTDLAAADRAAELCPVGCILRKRQGYRLPIGQRSYDARPIGSEIEAGRKPGS
jgi:[NiFe] hydrogenase diaphorase moiety small subunit